MAASFEERLRHHLLLQASGEKAEVFRALVAEWERRNTVPKKICPPPDARVDRLWFVRMKRASSGLTEDAMYCVVCCGGEVGFPLIEWDGDRKGWRLVLFVVEPASMLWLSDAHALTDKGAIVAAHMNHAVAIREATNFAPPLNKKLTFRIDKARANLDLSVWPRLLASETLGEALGGDVELAVKFRRWGCYVLKPGEKMTTTAALAMYMRASKGFRHKREDTNSERNQGDQVGPEKMKELAQEMGNLGLLDDLQEGAKIEHVPLTMATALSGVQPDNVYCLQSEYDLDVAAHGASGLASHLGTLAHTTFDYWSVLSGAESGRKRDIAVRVVRSFYPIAIATGAAIHHFIKTKHYGLGRPGHLTCMNFLLRNANERPSNKDRLKRQSYLAVNRQQTTDDPEGPSGYEQGQRNYWGNADNDYRESLEIDRMYSIFFDEYLVLAIRPDHVYVNESDVECALEIKTHWTQGWSSTSRDDGDTRANVVMHSVQAGMQAYAVALNSGKQNAKSVLCETRVPYVPNPTKVDNYLLEGMVSQNVAKKRMKIAFGVVGTLNDMLVGRLRMPPSPAETASACWPEWNAQMGMPDPNIEQFGTAYTNALTGLYQHAYTPLAGEAGELETLEESGFAYQESDRGWGHKSMCFPTMPARVTASLTAEFIASAFDGGVRLEGIPLGATFVASGTSVIRTSSTRSYATGGVWRVVRAYIEDDMNRPRFAREGD